MRPIPEIAQDICETSLPGANHTAVVRAIMTVLRKSNLEMGISITLREFEVHPNLTIPLPPECQSVIRVGVLGSNKAIIPMGNNEFIRRGVEASSCDGITEVSLEPTTAVVYQYYGYGTYQTYGKPENPFPAGYYRYNQSANRIELGDGPYAYSGQRLLVEYHSSLSKEAITFIPDDYELYITYLTIAHLLSVSDPNTSQYNLRLAHKQEEDIKRSRRPGPREIVSALTKSIYRR